MKFIINLYIKFYCQKLSFFSKKIIKFIFYLLFILKIKWKIQKICNLFPKIRLVYLNKKYDLLDKIQIKMF